MSCVPAGEYHVRIRKSPKYGLVFWLEDVEGRTYILIHAGNFGGDRLKKLKTHTYGCILLGLKRGWLAGQRAVFCSRIAVHQFMEHMQDQPFRLEIQEAFDA